MFWDVGLNLSIDASLGLVLSVTVMLTVYVSSVPVVGAVLLRRFIAASLMPCPDETRSNVPSCAAGLVHAASLIGDRTGTGLLDKVGYAPTPVTLSLNVAL